MRELVPEEDCDRAHKQLISHANQQWEITGTSNSTIRTRGKGWISADEDRSEPAGGASLVVVRRPEAMVVVLAEQPLLLEALAEPSADGAPPPSSRACPRPRRGERPRGLPMPPTPPGPCRGQRRPALRRAARVAPSSAAGAPLRADGLLPRDGDGPPSRPRARPRPRDNIARARMRAGPSDGNPTPGSAGAKSGPRPTCFSRLVVSLHQGGDRLAVKGKGGCLSPRASIQGAQPCRHWEEEVSACIASAFLDAPRPRGRLGRRC